MVLDPEVSTFSTTSLWSSLDIRNNKTTKLFSLKSLDAVLWLGCAECGYAHGSDATLQFLHTPFDRSAITRSPSEPGHDSLIRFWCVTQRSTAAAICGSDLHLYRGTRSPATGPIPGVTIGHEAMGYVAEVGEGVNFLSVGDYVVIPDRIDDGHLLMESETYTAYGTATLPGSQAEYVRVPYADNGLIPVPTTNGSEPLIDYLFLSDIFPTAWTALDYSGFQPGDSVAIFGAGPVGLLVAYSAMLRGASVVYSVDSVPSRLARAAELGAIPISFNTSDPVAQILALEPHGVTRSVYCVGYEAVNASLLPQENIVLQHMINVTSILGDIGVAGAYHVYEPEAYSLPISIGPLWAKSLTLASGAVNPMIKAQILADLITTGRARPSFIISSEISIEDAPEYYARFEQHKEQKVVIRFLLNN